MTLFTIPNAALDASDVCAVLSATLGLAATYVIQSIRMPLDATSNATIVLRPRRF